LADLEPSIGASPSYFQTVRRRLQTLLVSATLARNPDNIRRVMNEALIKYA
jgi:hypothetical protein